MTYRPLSCTFYIHNSFKSARSWLHARLEADPFQTYVSAKKFSALTNYCNFCCKKTCDFIYGVVVFVGIANLRAQLFT